MAYQQPTFGKLGQAALLPAKMGVTDVFKAPRNTPYDHPSAWAYLGRVAPGSFKNDFTRKYFDVVTGIPETVKESFVVETEGKAEFDLIEPTSLAYLTASGNGIRIPGYGTTVNVINDNRNSIEEVYVDTTYGLRDGDEVEVNHTDGAFYDGFDRDNASLYSSEGDVPGTWTHDPTNSRLSVVSAANTDHSTYLINGISLKDVDITVTSTQAHNGGLVWRYQDTNNYYLVQLSDDSGNTPTNNISVWRRNSGVFTQVGASNDLAWTRGVSATIQVTMTGNTIRVYFNGTLVMETTDSSIPTAGRAGFRNNSTTASRYSDITFKPYGYASAKEYSYITDLRGENNLFSYPENFESTYWTKNNLTVSSNNAINPNGLLLADKLVETVTNGYHYISMLNFLTSGRDYTLSVYAKAAERSRIWMGFNNIYVHFDLASGTVISSVGSPTSSSITDVGGGWYRCTVTKASLPGTDLTPVMGLISTGTTLSYAGDTSKGLYLWGYKVEEALVASDYETPMLRVFPRLTYAPEAGATVKEVQINQIASGSSGFERFALRAITYLTDGRQIVTWLSDCRVAEGMKDEAPDKSIIKVPIAVEAFGVYDTTQAQTLLGKKYLLDADVALNYTSDAWSDADGWIDGSFTRMELGSIKPVVTAPGVFARSGTAPKRDFSGNAATGVERYENVLPAAVYTQKHDFDFGGTFDRTFSNPEGSINNVGYTDGFDTDSSGLYTKGGDVAGTWTWNTGSSRLEGVATNAADYATCMLDGSSFKDIGVQVKLTQAHYAGILARYVDNNNYYMCNISDDSGSAAAANIRVWKRVAGVFTQLGSNVNLTMTRGTEYTVRFEVIGTSLNVYVDGSLVFTYNDAALTAAGKVGLLATYSTASYFTDFKIDQLTPLFSRNSVANKPDGSQVAAGLPRYVRGRNLMTKNQSNAEVNTAGFAASTNATATRDVTEFAEGVASFKIVTGNVGSDEGGIYTCNDAELLNKIVQSVHTGSVYLKGSGTVNVWVRFNYKDGTSLDSANTLATLSGSWVRYSATGTPTKAIKDVELHVRTNTQQGITFYLDKAQLERGATATTWEPGGDNAILIEEGTTNLCPSGSDDFSTSWLSYNNAVPTITSGRTDPYGGTSAYRVQMTTGDGTHILKRYLNLVSPSVNATKYSISLWVKVNSGTVAIGSNLGSGTSGTIAVSDGWKLVKIQNLTGDGAADLQLLFNAASISDAIDIDVMWPQGEAKAYCTSYIAPAATRAAERLAIPMASFLNAPAGTLIIRAYVGGDLLGTQAQHFLADSFNGTDNVKRLLFWSGNGTRDWRTQIGSDAGAIAGGNAATYVASLTEGWHTFGFRWDSTRNSQYIDGVEVAFGATPALPTSMPNILHIGCKGDATLQWNSPIGDVNYFPSYLDDATMAAITA